MKKEIPPDYPEGINRDLSGQNVRRKSDLIDVLIGLQVRKIRKEQNLTLKEISEGLNISYQQVQKYERGENRIAASTLLYISTILKQPIEIFYILAKDYLEE